MLLAQAALMLAGLANGGTSTALGGALLLASLWFMGANIGWFFRKRMEGGE